MKSYVPFNVYTNIVKMFDYRNIKLRGEQLTENQVSQRLNHYEFATIVGDRGPDPRGAAECYVILIASNSKYSAKSQDFKKLLKGLPKKTEGVEVMFVSELEFTNHIKKQLALFKSENPKIYVEDYDYEKFLIEMPKHVSVPKHELASDNEVAELCRRHFTTKEKFPKIHVGDTQCVWIGGKPGMVIKITRVSENSGEAIAYRIVIK